MTTWPHSSPDRHRKRTLERDALIAATAATHGLTVMTRNVKDFAPLEVAVVNPWEGTPR